MAYKLFDKDIECTFTLEMLYNVDGKETNIYKNHLPFFFSIIPN
jgi:hypothetical protein